MAIRRQVHCCNRIDSEVMHRRITHIGGRFADGSRWQATSEEAIRSINSGALELFVNVQGKEVDVVPAFYLGTQYLKTETDGYEPNNLLSLPACPD